MAQSLTPAMTVTQTAGTTLVQFNYTNVTVGTTPPLAVSVENENQTVNMNPA